jgi:hypothetical protein
MLIPPVMPLKAGRCDQTKGRQERRLLRDLDEAVSRSRSCRRACQPPPSGAMAPSRRQQAGSCCTTPRRSPSRPGWNTPVRVKWINELVDANGNYLPAPAAGRPDPALGQPARRDDRPRHASDLHETPGPYTGPVPMVTHVHGAVGVGDESDGYAEAWYLPAAGNIPAGYATEGTWYDFFAGKAAAIMARPGGRASPPSSTRTATAPRPSGTTTTRWA